MYIAKKHFRIGQKEFAPGDTVPEKLIENDTERWAWLTRKGALETFGDAVGYVVDDEPEDGADVPPAEETPEMEHAENEAELEGESQTVPDSEEAPEAEQEEPEEAMSPDDDLPDLPPVTGVDAVAPAKKPAAKKKG